MEIKLLKLNIQNFKGIRNFVFEPDGDDRDIYAENGIGKTTIYDAFLWLLFGKNSEGKTDFDLRTLDEHNKTIKGLVLAVEAVLLIDGEHHVFRKEHHEKVIKKQLRGYEAICSIDEVPKKKGEYETYIATEIITEDVFRMLTDLQRFNTMHHTEQRKILLDIASDIEKPSGFDESLGKLNGRSIADYKSVLTGRKNRYTLERGEINPRLDEIHKGLIAIATNMDRGLNTKEVGDQRAQAIREKAELDKQKKAILNGESARQAQVEEVTQLKARKTILEGRLSQGDPSRVGALCREKLVWEEKLAMKRDELSARRRSVADAMSNLAETENTLRLKLQRLDMVREEYPELKAATLDEKCSACGQSLPADKVEVLKKKKVAGLQELASTGNRLNGEADEIVRVKVKQQEHLDQTRKAIEDAEDAFGKLLDTQKEAIAKIDEKIEQVKKAVPFEEDDEWKRLNAQLQDAEKNIGPSLAAGMGVNDDQKEQCQKRIDAANLILANKDTIEKDKARIAELEERETDLAQLIADIDKQLAGIEEYNMEESRLIEEAVNGMFQHVTFKLFNRLLNGGIEDTCEAMLNGTPYAAMSTGEKIFVGIDIINVLSGHYGVSVVLFVDHRESMTMPLETDAQVIGLFAEKGTKELIVRAA